MKFLPVKLSPTAAMLTCAFICVGLQTDSQCCETDYPNIIVFLVDDMGLMDTSVPMLCDSEGKPVRHPLNQWYRTPNMQRLADAGIRFSTFYAQSVCSPTRVSIMTGQNAARHRTTNWIHGKQNNRTKFGPPDWNWTGIGKKDVTLPRMLQGIGYRTIHVGKAHFGPNGHAGSDPTNIGFDVNVAGHSGGHPASYYAKDRYGNSTNLEKKNHNAVPGLEKYYGSDTYLTEALTVEAVNQIDEAIEAGKPYFLYLSHYAVHSPFHLDSRFANNYSKMNRTKQQRAFCTMIEGVDKSLGDVLSRVNSHGHLKNTVVFFLGDNGTDARIGQVHEHGSSAPLRGMKGTEYEGGMRVPFIASWLQQDSDNKWQANMPIAVGQFQTQLGTVNDLFPTILALLNQELPDGHTIDGFNLKTQLAGKHNADRPASFLMHFPHSHRSNYFTSWRDGVWKLIYYYRPASGKPQHRLYHLEDDPYENNDLSKANPEQLAKMIESMSRKLREQDALYPVNNQGDELKPQVPALAENER